MSLIPFAYSRTLKKLVDATEVPRGLACCCICPSCSMRLQARQGEVNEHHFSHYDKAQSKCEYSYWVSIRDMAKQILKEVKYIKIRQYDSSNLQFIPYKLGSFLIKIFHTSKNNNFDLVLHTSIGELNLSFLTPEINRLNNEYPKKDVFSKLILEINLSGMTMGSTFSKKEQLKELLVRDLKSKKLLSSSFEFFNYEEDESLEEADEKKNDYPVYRNMQGATTVEEIAKCLYLDSRSLTYRQRDAIKRMETFYTVCSKKHFEVLFSQEYTICHKEHGFEYISYENEFYALADVDGIYVVYRFDNFFVKILSTRDYKNVYHLLKKEHSDASNAF